MKKEILWKKIKSETKTIWAGEIESFPYGSTQPPMINSVAYEYEDMDDWMAVAKGEKDGHIYGRNTHPTVQILEEKIALVQSMNTLESKSILQNK